MVCVCGNDVGVWQLCVLKMVFDKDVYGRWNVLKMVCDKDVYVWKICERLCVKDGVWQNCACDKRWCVTKMCVTKLCDKDVY